MTLFATKLNTAAQSVRKKNENKLELNVWSNCYSSGGLHAWLSDVHCIKTSPQPRMVAKLGKDPSCAKGSKHADLLVSSHFTLPTLPSNLWGNVSAITDVRFFWMAAAHKSTHLLSASYWSNWSSRPSHTQARYSRLSAIVLHIILTVADWMFTQMAQPSDRAAFRFPATWRGAARRWITPGLWPSFICVALLGFRHHSVHVAERATGVAMFYWQGQRDTNCTTICVLQHNRAGCDPLFLFLKCHLREIWWTNDSIIHAPDRITSPILLMFVWFDGRQPNRPSWQFRYRCSNHQLRYGSPHTQTGLQVFRMKWTCSICMFSLSLFLFFWVLVDAWFGVGDSLGLLGLGEAITHLNKNDEPPSEHLCLPAQTCPDAPLSWFYSLSFYYNKYRESSGRSEIEPAFAPFLWFPLTWTGKTRQKWKDHDHRITRRKMPF